MTGPKLVQIRGGAPLLNDIPSQLERIAKDLREGRLQFQRVIVVAEDFDGDPQAYAFGEVRPAMHDIGLLDYAKDIVKDCIVDHPPKVPA